MSTELATNDEATAIVIGAPVYYDAANGVKKAKADSLAHATLAGLMSTVSTAAGATGVIQTAGKLTATTTQWDAITGGSGGLTFGTVYYVDPSTAGKLTSTKPSTSGQVISEVGLGMSPTELQLRIHPPLDVVQVTGYHSGKTAADTSVATWTVGASDGLFAVRMYVNVTTSTTHNFSCQVSYTDETNTAQTVTLDMIQADGSTHTAITNGTGSGPYMSQNIAFRAKSATTITLKTAGTFTTVTYDVGGSITWTP